MFPLPVRSVSYHPIPSHITYMCAGVAAEIEDSCQYRVMNTQGVQTPKNTIKTTYSTNRLFQNTNKTANKTPERFIAYKKADSEHRYNNLPLQDSTHLLKVNYRI
jgi:predicted Zn-dependent protease with MMP-like domain